MDRSPHILSRFSLLLFLYSIISHPLLPFVPPYYKPSNYLCSTSTTFDEVSHEILTLQEVLRPVKLPPLLQLPILNSSLPSRHYLLHSALHSTPLSPLSPISISLLSRPIPPFSSPCQRKRLSLLLPHRRVLSKCWASVNEENLLEDGLKEW